MSSFASAYLLCCNCKGSLSNATADNFHDDIVVGVVGIKCPNANCHTVFWACLLCAKTWSDVSNNKKHVISKKHLQKVREQQQQQQQLAARRVQAPPPASDSIEVVWPDNDDDDLLFDPDAASNDDDDRTNGKCDWLTSIPGELGPPARTLESIKLYGSFHPRSKSPEFYWYESQHPGHGAKYLTAKPFTVEPAEVTNEEAEFHLRTAKFLTRLTKADQEEFAYCMLQVLNAGDETLSIFKSTRPPHKVKDFDDFYLTGTKSVAENVPTAVVETTADGTHSYCTLTDVLQNKLASSTAVDQFQFQTDMVPQGLDSDFFDDEGPATISNTRAAYSLFLDLKKEEGPGFVLYLWIKRWCDDFDPNNTKQSRNQVWLMTNTICPPPGENKGRNTFFMALGQKGDDHGEIDKLFEEELRVLSGQGKIFYHGGRRELIKVKAGTVCVCVDRPERASLYQVGDHTGSFSALWCHAVEVDGKCVDNCLPSCPFCRRKRLQSHFGSEGPDNSTDCPDECVDWNFMDTKFTCSAPADYPCIFDEREGAPQPPKGREIINSDEDQRLPCIYLTIPWLRQAVTFAHHQLKTRLPTGTASQKYWTKAQSTAFLRTCGIGSKLYDAIYESAQRKDAVPPLPYSWNTETTLQSTHYAAMHMLFLGHAKSNYDMVNKLYSLFAL